MDLDETHKCDSAVEDQGCIEVDRSKDQVYLTCDDGDSFVMVTPPSLAKTSGAGGARVSGDGRYVAFCAKIATTSFSSPQHDELMKYDVRLMIFSAKF